jgi:hypothetical protein
MKINHLAKCFSHDWLTYCLRHADIKFKKLILTFLTSGGVRSMMVLSDESSIEIWHHITVAVFSLIVDYNICETWLTAVLKVLSTICSTF